MSPKLYYSQGKDVCRGQECDSVTQKEGKYIEGFTDIPKESYSQSKISSSRQTTNKQYGQISPPLFRQPLTKGSWAGLVTLTAYMAAKKGIEEYLMDFFKKTKC